MTGDDKLLPLKRVIEEVGVSRSTLWRAAQSGIEGFPAPVLERRRVYWRKSEIDAIKRCLHAFKGRGDFDARKRREREREAACRLQAVLTQQKAKPQARRRRSRAAPQVNQGDLFGR